MLPDELYDLPRPIKGDSYLEGEISQHNQDHSTHIKGVDGLRKLNNLSNSFGASSYELYDLPRPIKGDAYLEGESWISQHHQDTHIKGIDGLRRLNSMSNNFGASSLSS